jgi:NADH-quinone oxidoreductase subunit M
VRAPVLAAFFVAATFASIGLPGFANFWGELTIFIAIWKFSPALTAIAIGGVIISAIYGLRAAARIFFGPPTERMTEVATKTPPTDLRWAEKIPALVLLAGLLFLGIWPKSMSDSIDAALTRPSVGRVIAPMAATNAIEPRRVSDNAPYLANTLSPR